MEQKFLFDTFFEIGNTCRECKNRERWECNSKVFQYCRVRKSNRTQNGLLKIKCKDKACVLFNILNNEKE